MAVVASTGTSPGADSTTCVITKPSGLAAGDLIVAAVSMPSGVAITPPSSAWKAIVRGSYHWWFYKIADSTDAAASNFTFTLGSSGSNIGFMARITGFSSVVHMGDPTVAGSSGASATTGTVTFKTANSLMLGIASQNRNGTWTGSVSNANVTLTEVLDFGTAAGTDSSIAFYTGAWNGTSSADTTFTANRGTTSTDMDCSAIMVYDTNDFNGEATTAPLYRHTQAGYGTTIEARPDLAVGDLMVVWMESDNSGTPTAPTGWEQIRNGDTAGAGSFGQMHTSLWAKIADSTDVTNLSWSFSVPFGNCYFGLFRISYADTVDAVDGSTAAFATDATASPPNIMPTMSGYTPTVTDSLFMMFTAQRRIYNSIGTRYMTTNNPTWVERHVSDPPGYANFSQGSRITMATGQRASSAATGNAGLSGTNAGYADSMSIAMINIKPIQPVSFRPMVHFVM